MIRHFLTLTLCAGALLATPPQAKPVLDRDLGLSKTSVFEAPAPPAFKDEASGPGEAPLPKRINKEYPPVIPHAIADCVPITLASNLCLDCHALKGPKKKGEPTPVPASHYTDYRRAPEAKGKQVSGARFVCVSCHVPRTNAPALVGSSFKP